ncbi:MAG: hypothetical protein GOV00_00990 [Candidatus Altiarchaeota archaeon]|nr:hypothetical protein [Candidatus Altiarchaeota archaeon]
MEINRITPLLCLLLAFILPELRTWFLILSVFFAIAPFYISESKRLKFDKNATKILLHLSSLSNISELKIAEATSKFEGYKMTHEIFKRTGKLKFPDYGRRSKNLSMALYLVLQTGKREILSNATTNAIRSDAAESELHGLISSERYNLIFSSISLGAILGVVNAMAPSPLFFVYVVFQAFLSSLWLFFISGKFIESLSFLPPLVLGAFYFASVLV